MPCIYYGDKPGLTYDSQEHVFPLGLGGIQMLPKGTVCDQVNNIFSLLEMKFMRSSLVSVIRAFEGPGSTSKHKPAKASESQVTVSSMKNEPTLSYLKQGKPYPIYQFAVFDKHLGVSLPKDGKLEDFKEDLRKYKGQFVYLQSNFLNNNDFLVGCHNNKYYVVTRDKLEREIVGKRLVYEIKRFLTAKENDNLIEKTNQATFDFLIEENVSTDRVYAKIALNVITHLLGADYTYSRFEQLKQWILTGNGENNFIQRTRPNDFDCLMQLMPELSHWCYFQPCNGHLAGLISFYNNSVCQRFFDFGNTDYPDDLPNGFICDWKNQHEYKLIELLSLPEDVITKNIIDFQNRLNLRKLG